MDWNQKLGFAVARHLANHNWSNCLRPHQLCSNPAYPGCFSNRCWCSTVVGTLNVRLGSATFFGKLTVPEESRNAARARPCISLGCTRTMLTLPWDGTALHGSIGPCTSFRDMLQQAGGSPRLPSCIRHQQGVSKV